MWGLLSLSSCLHPSLPPSLPPSLFYLSYTHIHTSLLPCPPHTQIPGGILMAIAAASVSRSDFTATITATQGTAWRPGQPRARSRAPTYARHAV